MVFKTPWILILIPFIVGGIYFWQKRQKGSAFRFPSKSLFLKLPKTFKITVLPFLFWLRLAAIGLFLFALAGPRSILEKTKHEAEGIDIVLTLDISESMAQEDFIFNNRPVNRLEIVKNVVADFIKKRINDRIGIVAFASVAYMVCPLTTDYSWLEENLNRVELGLVQYPKTAIGSGIMTSITRLKTSTAKSKVIVLLTDGENNAGKIAPVAAAEIARNFGIKIYTIGAASDKPIAARDLFGGVRYFPRGNEVDEATLIKVAQLTGGQYFRATDTQSLENIYKQIDALEKVKIEHVGYVEYKELFDQFLLLALALLVIEIVLSNTVLLKIP